MTLAILSLAGGGFMGATLALSIINWELRRENRRMSVALDQWRSAYINGELGILHFAYPKRPGAC